MMNRRFSLLIILLLLLAFFGNESKAMLSGNKNATTDSPMPAVLKANQVDGDRENNVLNATGNVELTKGPNILFSDQLSYDKNQDNIYAAGHVHIKNYDIGNVFADNLTLKSDFTSGKFNHATIVMVDGSYIKSPQIIRLNQQQTLFTKPIFSICPNPDIASNNSLANQDPNFLTMTSESTMVDKSTETIKTSNGVLRIYNFPIFYTPYLSTPLPSSKRKSGFLDPSYIKTNKLGSGVRIPYYFNIAPDRDLTTTAEYHPLGGHLLLDNDYRQLTTMGLYTIKLELANNKPKSNNLINGTSDTASTTESLRWQLKAKGDFVLSPTVGLTFDINNVGDKNYLHDYYNDFITDHTVSTVDLNYIKDQEYASAKVVKIQELGIGLDSSQAPLAAPVFNYYNQFKPTNGGFNQTYSLLANATAITRENGPQYRRTTIEPGVKIPYNLNGNLFELAGKVQGDFYNLGDHESVVTPASNYPNFESNYRPQASLKWSLPMINKTPSNTIIFEPIAVATSSAHSKNSGQLPNEDSNNTELTQGNIFLSDHFTGFDRAESGERLNYGFNSSLFNDLGKFNFGLGESLKYKAENQDVTITGFDNSSRSNFVGELGYKANKIFSMLYDFQLNQSNYRNEINQISTNFDFGRFNFGVSDLLLRKSDTNLTTENQATFNAKAFLTKNVIFTTATTRDLILGRNVSTQYALNYNGCCVIYGFVFTESNPSALTKPSTTYKINFVIKNL